MVEDGMSCTWSVLSANEPALSLIVSALSLIVSFALVLIVFCAQKALRESKAVDIIKDFSNALASLDPNHTAFFSKMKEEQVKAMKKRAYNKETFMNSKWVTINEDQFTLIRTEIIKVLNALEVALIAYYATNVANKEILKTHIESAVYEILKGGNLSHWIDIEGKEMYPCIEKFWQDELGKNFEKYKRCDKSRLSTDSVRA